MKASAGTRAYEPAYRRLAQCLAQEILSGQLPPGSRLPPEEQLAPARKVSRFTLRKALDLLDAQGMIRRCRGMGTYVTGGSPEKRWFSTAANIQFLFVASAGRLVEPPNRFYRGILGGARQMAREQGLRLLVEGLRSYTRVVLEEYRPPKPSDVGGVIVCGAFDEQYMRMFGSEGIPVVAADFYSHNPQVDSVVVDVESDAYMAIDHLTAKGHRQIGFLATGRRDRGQDGYDPDIHRMLDNLRHAARQSGVEIRDEWVLLMPGIREAQHAAISAVINRPRRPTALICFNEAATRSTLHAIRAAGLRCPEDVSLLGRGAVDIEGLAVTSLVNDPEMMGRLAVRLLLERMRGQRQRGVRIGVTTTLVLGQTTGPPAGTWMRCGGPSIPGA